MKYVKKKVLKLQHFFTESSFIIKISNAIHISLANYKDIFIGHINQCYRKNIATRFCGIL